MKTLFLLELHGKAPSLFFELEGDYSYLNEVEINGYESTEEQQNELMGLLYGNDSDPFPNFYYIITTLKKPTKDWDHFVKVGVIP
jgi:hypothetical protein